MKPRKTEHPILFSTPMVQAILALIKNMTRRTKGLEIVNQDPDSFRYINKSNDDGVDFPIPADDKFTDGIWYCFQKRNNNGVDYILQCPFGQPGDKLWVKEMYYAYGYWMEDGKTKTGKKKQSFVDVTGTDFVYKYQENKPERLQTGKSYKMGWYMRNSLFMPKSAARLWFEITNVRVERLQDISHDDAKLEGVKHVIDKITGYCGYDYITGGYNLLTSPYNGFRSLWKKINGEESWNANPWVWVIEFKRIDN